MKTRKQIEQEIADLKKQSEELDKTWVPYKKFMEEVESELATFGYGALSQYAEYLPRLNEQERYEMKLWLCQRAWKKEFDNVEVKWGGDEEHYYIYLNIRSKKYKTLSLCYMKENMQVFFSTRDKAEQCLQWLKDLGVIDND